MPRSDAVVQLFILLCSIVSFVFLFNQQCEITDFLEDQQISLKKTDIKQTAESVVQKCKCKRLFSLYFRPLPRKLIVQLLSVNVGDDLELYFFSSE